MTPKKTEIFFCQLNVVLSLILFFGTITQVHPYRPTSTPLITFSWSTQADCLFTAYLTGQSKCLTKELKQAHQNLGLTHLFTPSGIHLAALFLPLTPFIQARFAWARTLQFIILVLLYPLLKWIIPSPAGARMILITMSQHGLSKLSPQTERRLHSGLFLGIALDTLLGGLVISPSSFALSYLFLALINWAIEVNLSKWRIYFIFFVVQACICSFWGKEFYPVGALLGQGLSLLFTPFFIVGMLVYAGDRLIPIFSIWIQLIEGANQYAKHCGQWMLGFEHIFLLVFMFFKIKNKWIGLASLLIWPISTDHK